MTFGNPFGLALYDKDQANVAGSNGAGSKSKFIADCRQTIAQFADAEALVRWWNCASSKGSRRDLGLTYEEIEGLKGLVLARRAELKKAA